MSSHREAPEISKDPVADSTDVYAFVSPDQPDKVTLIANYIPLQEPAGGPNFFNMDTNVVYNIHIDNTGGAVDDLKCILHGISQDLGLKLAAVAGAKTGHDQDLALRDMGFLLRDNVEVITAPPQPAA